MNATKDRAMSTSRIALALGLFVLGNTGLAQAQLLGGQKPGRATTAPAAKAPSAKPEENPGLKEVRVPANPSDAIAVINGQIISRQQLADECIARKGKEILDTLIARTLIEQAMRAQKLEVTPAEIDQEIDGLAMKMGGVSREIWLRTLDKERGISPAQYARDIIYPSLALKKLAAPRVQVTEQDIKDAFEANFGPRLRCRIIMTDGVHKANEIWETLRKNPGGFEALAKERSLDSSTRALGGLLPDAIARHAYPRNVSDAAFRQLVDGDPDDKDPSHKPKDGDITGPIQVAENSWVIIRREALEPGKKNTLAEPAVRESLRSQMFEVKQNAVMGELMSEFMKNSSIENRLTGLVKLANEEQLPEAQVDKQVKLMGAEAQPATKTATPPPATRTATAPKVPAGVSADAAKVADEFRQTLKDKPAAAPR